MSFELVADFDFDFDFESALFAADEHHDYAEIRIQALDRLNGRLHMLVFVGREDGIRVVSLRMANKREVKRYDQAS